MNENCALIEAILSLEAEPVDERHISRIAGLNGDEVTAGLDDLRNHYNRGPHGVQIAKFPGGWALTPKKSLWELLKAHYGREQKNTLSQAALETLSIIAYSQPIARLEIESIRGVGVEGVLRALRSKDLIREIRRQDVPGRPVLYGTTKEFLERFNLKSIFELPKLDENDNKKFSANASS